MITAEVVCSNNSKSKSKANKKLIQTRLRLLTSWWSVGRVLLHVILLGMTINFMADGALRSAFTVELQLSIAALEATAAEKVSMNMNTNNIHIK